MIKTLSMTGETDTMLKSSSAINTIKSMKVWQLFARPKIRQKTIFLTFAWIANALTYYAIAYNLENVGGNFYVVFCFQALVEAPAAILNIFVLDRFGRVWPQALFMLASGGFAVSVLLGNLIGTWYKVLAMVAAKFFISSR